MWNPIMLALSAATVVWSTVTGRAGATAKTDSKQPKVSSPSSSLLSTRRITISPEMSLFLSGVVVTLTTQYLLQVLIRNTHFQRLKTMFNNVMAGAAGPTDKADVFLHSPTTLTSSNNGNLLGDEYQIENADNVPGSRVWKLVAPDITNTKAKTNSMHISVLEIPPKCELASQRSPPFVEFYYVLSGSGLVSQQGMQKTMPISAGQVWVVDPLCVRWISNKNSNGGASTQQPLKLLRVTDAGSLYSRPNQVWNEIRWDPNHSAINGGTSLSLLGGSLSKGLAKVQQAAAEYYTTGGGEGGVGGTKTNKTTNKKTATFGN